MIIKGGTVFQENGTFVKKDIQIENGRIVAVTEPDGNMTNMDVFACVSCDGQKNSVDGDTDDKRQIIDATGFYVLPGLIDIHSHGAVGHDFSDGDLDGLQEILTYQCAHGVTGYCPTSMTMSKEKLLEIYGNAGKWDNGKSTKLSDARVSTIEDSVQIKNAHIVGFHMEGPFLDSAKKGAHREEDIIAPNVDFFRKCNKACGNRIRLVTIAPNAEGALEFVQILKSSNVDESIDSDMIKSSETVNEDSDEMKRTNITISLGHTSADYDTAKAALGAGASHVTHLFNAMAPMNHREPGLIAAASEDENCFAELICDGVHVHESMVRAAFKLFPGRIVLISDSMRATGLGDGRYDLGGQQVCVTGNLAKLKDGTIAGSVTNLFDCMRKAIAFGISPEDAIAAATMNPAKSIGIFDEVGSLSVGKRADIILVDKEFNLVQIIKSDSEYE